MEQILKRILIFICLLSFFGGLIYRVYSLNYLGVILALILAIAASQYLYEKLPVKKITLKQTDKLIAYFIYAAYFVFWLATVIILWKSGSAKSIISPWQVVPAYFWLYYLILTALLLHSLIKKLRCSPLILGLHFFLSFSIALLVYKIGYGFDPFIHQATVNLITEKGSVDPKPFYYLGQYGLVAIIHKLLFIPVPIIDKLLIPLLSAIYLPIFIIDVIKKLKFKSILAVLFLIFPFSFLIVTTPQNFSYLLLLIVILRTLASDDKLSIKENLIISLAALITQPIAGIPALALTIISWLKNTRLKYKKYLSTAIYIGSTLILPILFFILQKSNTGQDDANPVKNLLALPKFIIPGQENFLLNFIYLYGFNLKIIFAILAITGIFFAIKNKAKNQISLNYFYFSLSWLAAYLLTKLLPFNFLINYERDDYANRLLLITGLFLLPYVLPVLNMIVRQFNRRPKLIRFIGFLSATCLIALSLYFSYPRFDNYFNSKGYSVSQNEIDAVRWINSDAGDKKYIVLANQQVSVAALNEFGFNNYYKNNTIFYYPIPTGGPLYQFYLNMVYAKPTKQTMSQAMDLADVKTGYFVLNKYWWAFNKILDEAKLSADSFKNIGNGEIYIFKYVR